jgi:uncharacterized protein (TIGR02271 family)
MAQSAGDEALPADEASHAGDNLVEFRLADGRRLLVPRELIQHLPDGGLHVACNASEVDSLNSRLPGEADASPAPTPSSSSKTIVVPVAEERLEVGRRTIVTGKVRVTTHTHAREEVIDIPLTIEQAQVERVPIGREVDHVPAVRQEGSTYIVPVVEEMLEVRKKLVLREEVRLTLSRSEVHQPQHVTLRQQEAIIEKIPNGNPRNPT